VTTKVNVTVLLPIFILDICSHPCMQKYLLSVHQALLLPGQNTEEAALPVLTGAPGEKEADRQQLHQGDKAWCQVQGRRDAGQQERTEGSKEVQVGLGPGCPRSWEKQKPSGPEGVGPLKDGLRWKATENFNISEGEGGRRQHPGEEGGATKLE
jgi:hypothetical protein